MVGEGERSDEPCLFKSKTCIHRRSRNADSGKGFSGEGVPVAVPVAELGALPPVPAGDPAVILGDPGEAVHICGTAMAAFLKESPQGGAAAVAGGELGGKDDLVALGFAERPDDKAGEGVRRGLGGPQFDVGDSPRPEEGVEASLHPDPRQWIDRRRRMEVGGVRIIDLPFGEIAPNVTARQGGEVL